MPAANGGPSSGAAAIASAWTRPCVSATLAAAEVKLWDLHNGQDVLTLSAEARYGAALQFSADGHRLFLLNPVGTGFGAKAFELHTWDATPRAGAAP